MVLHLRNFIRRKPSRHPILSDVHLEAIIHRVVVRIPFAMGSKISAGIRCGLYFVPLQIASMTPFAE